MDETMDNSEEGKNKRKEWGESDRFASFEKILNDFIKIIKENLCGYIDEKSQEKEVLYALSKIELCEICEFEEYCKIFSKYFYKLDYEKAQNWLDPFFHKLPSPWDTKTRNGYPDYLKRIEKKDNLGQQQ